MVNFFFPLACSSSLPNLYSFGVSEKSFLCFYYLSSNELMMDGCMRSGALGAADADEDAGFDAGVGGS